MSSRLSSVGDISLYSNMLCHSEVMILVILLLLGKSRIDELLPRPAVPGTQIVMPHSTHTALIKVSLWIETSTKCDSKFLWRRECEQHIRETRTFIQCVFVVMHDPTSHHYNSESRPPQRRTELPFVAVVPADERSEPSFELECPKTEGPALSEFPRDLLSPSLAPWTPHFEPNVYRIPNLDRRSRGSCLDSFSPMSMSSS